MDIVETPQSRCLAGVARGEVTPPVGIYHRMWGAATHERSTGIHRPLTATVLYLSNLRGLSSADAHRVIVALDHCLLWRTEMRGLLERISRTARVDAETIIVFFSHTHAAGLMGLERKQLPGGESIPAYLEQLGATIASLVHGARENSQPATIAYAHGRCDLATNRDYFDHRRRHYVCGFNPQGEADDTVLVARVTSDAGRTLATLVNYACHPTTLAWQNTLISPDYVGAMREVVERSTSAPCLFVQGASGDIGPKEGFVGDPDVADRNGRRLGYSALAALEGLPDPQTQFQYEGPVVSGATLGIWRHVPVSDKRRQQLADWQSCHFNVCLPYRFDLPDSRQLEKEQTHWREEEQQARAAGEDARARDARAMVERMTRRLTRLDQLPPGKTFPYPVNLWRIGDAVWLALDGEFYNRMQRGLRARFPGVPMVIGTLANGSSAWYLPDARSYGRGLYQEDASVLAKGSLETLLEAITDKVAQTLQTKS